MPSLFSVDLWGLGASRRGRPWSSGEPTLSLKDGYDFRGRKKARRKHIICKCLPVEMNIIEAGENMTRKTCDDVSGRL